MTAKLDLFNGTTLTRALTHRGGDSATRVVYVDNSTDTRDMLASAITEAATALGANHPDDSSLPTSFITARALASGKIMLAANYRRPAPMVDLYRAAKAQTIRRTGTESFLWWRDSTSFDSDGLPNGPIIFEPYDEDTPQRERVPRPYALTVGVQSVSMPTILDDHPTTTFLSMVGTVNGAPDSQFLTTGAFPSGTLYFDGWSSSYIGNGQFLVVYRAIYMRQKWPVMLNPFWDTSESEWSTSIEPRYESGTWGTLPVHTVLT